MHTINKVSELNKLSIVLHKADSKLVYFMATHATLLTNSSEQNKAAARKHMITFAKFMRWTYTETPDTRWNSLV